MNLSNNINLYSLDHSTTSLQAYEITKLGTRTDCLNYPSRFIPSHSVTVSSTHSGPVAGNLTQLIPGIEREPMVVYRPFASLGGTSQLSPRRTTSVAVLQRNRSTLVTSTSPYLRPLSMVNVVTYAASAAATLAGAAYDYVVVGGGNVLCHNSINLCAHPDEKAQQVWRSHRGVHNPFLLDHGDSKNYLFVLGGDCFKDLLRTQR